MYIKPPPLLVMSRYSVGEVSTRFYVKLFFLLLRLTRLATLLLASNRKGNCNKARIRYKHCWPLDYLDL